MQEMSYNKGDPNKKLTPFGLRGSTGELITTLSTDHLLTT